MDVKRKSSSCVCAEKNYTRTRHRRTQGIRVSIRTVITQASSFPSIEYLSSLARAKPKQRQARRTHRYHGDSRMDCHHEETGNGQRRSGGLAGQRIHHGDWHWQVLEGWRRPEDSDRARVCSVHDSNLLMEPSLCISGWSEPRLLPSQWKARMQIWRCRTRVWAKGSTPERRRKQSISGRWLGKSATVHPHLWTGQLVHHGFSRDCCPGADFALSTTLRDAHESSGFEQTDKKI